MTENTERNKGDYDAYAYNNDDIIDQDIQKYDEDQTIHRNIGYST